MTTSVKGHESHCTFQVFCYVAYVTKESCSLGKTCNALFRFFKCPVSREKSYSFELTKILPFCFKFAIVFEGSLGTKHRLRFANRLHSFFVTERDRVTHIHAYSSGLNKYSDCNE